MPDPSKLLNTIKQAVAHTKAVPGRTGKFVDLADADEVLVVGDMHGNLGNFKKILQFAKLGEFPKRHVVLQELVHGPFRYPDGGDLSHRLVDIVCAYMCQYPGRVHYLLSNHELAQWTRREISKSNESLNGLFIAGVNTAYDEYAEAMLAAYDELFESLPVAIRLPNRIFLSHSLPGGSRLEAWNLDLLKKEKFTEEDYKLGGCVHAVVWGRDTSEETLKRYLELVDADLLVCGHFVTELGFQVPNNYQVIIDCTNDSAYALLIPTKETLSQEQVLDRLVKLKDLAG